MGLYKAIYREKLPNIQGEKHPLSKLTKENVLKILELNKKDNIGCKKLGRIFNVNPSTIQDILNNKSWKSIPRNNI